MTTAARPTFDPAKGGSGMREKSLGKLSQQVSARDLPAHLTLKERKSGQDTIDEIRERDLRVELEEREKIATLEKTRNQHKYIPSLEQTAQVRLALKAERDKERIAEKDALLDSESLVPDSDKGVNIINARKMAQLDADEDFGVVDSDSDIDFDKPVEHGDGERLSDSDDDDSDDSAELLAELQRIKQERQAELEKKNLKEKEREEQKRSNASDVEETPNFAIKRRWDDDVPFKNCARGDNEPKRKLYLNDTLRQDFHKRFMDKYIG